jgi:hypothetical protein
MRVSTGPEEAIMTTRRIPHLLIPGALLLAFLLNACGLLQPLVIDKRSDGWIDWDNKGGWSGYESSADGFYLEESGSSLTLGSAPGEPLSSGEAEKSETSPERSSQFTSMRAGSVDDNAEWDDYLLYRLRFSDTGIPVHDLDISERHIIHVDDANGLPLLGALVTIRDADDNVVSRLRTHSDGPRSR